MSVVLNEGQTAALEALELFILDPTQTEFILSGAAGTGKTFIMRELLKSFKKLTLRSLGAALDDVLITASTNKAANALQYAVGSSYEVDTFFTALNIYPYKNYDTGESQLRARKNSTVDNLFIIIDEYSYVDEEAYKLIKKQTPNCKILYVGDAYQLPPVGSPVSYVDGLGIPKAELTQIMRQGEHSAIQKLSYALRESIRLDMPLPQVEANDVDLILLPRQAFERQMIASMQNNASNKYVAYQNKTVQFYNTNLHKVLQNNTADYNVGDICTVNRYIKFTDKRAYKPEHTVVIESIKPSLRMINGSSYTGFSVTLDGYKFFMPHDSSLIDKLTDVSADVFSEERAAILTNWIDLRHAYACTVHKSQGSTFDEVFIDIADIAKCRFTDPALYARLLYVAISRASSKVYFTTESL